MSNENNGNHIPEDNPTPAEAATRHVKSWLAKITRQLVWLVPIIAIINIAQAVIPLGFKSEHLEKAVSDASQTVIRLDPDPWICIATSVVTLVYWGVRDGWDRIFKRPLMNGIRAWWRKTTAEWRAEELAKREATSFAKGEATGITKGEAIGFAKGYARAMAEMDRNTGSSPDGDHPPQSDNRTS